MNPGRATIRRLATCLALSAVLILGIVQWSFLPVLIESPSFSGGASVEVSPGHSSKFAAPFKYLSGTIDSLQACLTSAGLGAPIPPLSFSRYSDEPCFRHDDQASPHRCLRSPPSA